MKMNIKEVIKGTKLPCEQSKGLPDMILNSENEYIADCMLHYNNAALIAHCLNHFPKLLEALKYANKLLGESYDHHSPCVLDAIEAASEVEVNDV